MCSRWSLTAAPATAAEPLTTLFTASVTFASAAFSWPKATDSSLARFDLNALRTRLVTLFTSSMGALVTESTASTAEDTESVISFTSSRIWSTRMISRLAASTVSDTRSTSGSTLAATGSSEAVMRSTLASVGSTCFCTCSTVLRVLRTVITSSTTSQISAAPTST